MDELRAVREGLGQVATDLDPAVLRPSDAEAVLTEVSRIENVAASLRCVVAARVADTGSWKRAGQRSAAHHLARRTGTSVGQERRRLNTARQLESLGRLADEARSGGLSPTQVALVADAAIAAPSSEAALINMAERTSLAELTEECARVKATVTDAEARRAKVHAERFLRSYGDSEGGSNLRVRNTPEAVAQIMAALGPITDRLFRAARAEGRREPVEAYAADALAELAAGSQSTKPDASRVRSTARAKVLVRVDLEALLRGYPRAGEVCEIVGFGPVAVSAIREMIDTGNPFLAAIATKGEQVLGVAHIRRRPNAHQRTALEWMYPSCAREGCPAHVPLENDHREDWARSHVTIADLMDRLCTHDHDLKTNEGWALVEGKGKRALVPPADPRHPRHAGHPPATGPPAAA